MDIFSLLVKFALSSPFSPQGLAARRAGAGLSRSAWEPPFTMRKKGLSSARDETKGAGSPLDEMSKNCDEKFAGDNGATKLAAWDWSVGAQ